jgi:hypothetical protein
LISQKINDSSPKGRLLKAMRRTRFLTTPQREIDVKLLRYQEACKLFNEFEKIKSQLAHLGTIFADVEDAINKAISKIPQVALVYGRRDEAEWAEAFTHNGKKFTVTFEVRHLITTQVYPVSLKITDVLGLTPEALVGIIRGQLYFRGEA